MLQLEEKEEIEESGPGLEMENAHLSSMDSFVTAYVSLESIICNLYGKFN